MFSALLFRTPLPVHFLDWRSSLQQRIRDARGLHDIRTTCTTTSARWTDRRTGACLPALVCSMNAIMYARLYWLKIKFARLKPKPLPSGGRARD